MEATQIKERFNQFKNWWRVNSILKLIRKAADVERLEDLVNEVCWFIRCEIGKEDGISKDLALAIL